MHICRRKFIGVGTALAASLLTGCQNKAYTENTTITQGDSSNISGELLKNPYENIEVVDHTAKIRSAGGDPILTVSIDVRNKGQKKNEGLIVDVAFYNSDSIRIEERNAGVHEIAGGETVRTRAQIFNPDRIDKIRRYELKVRKAPAY